MDNPDQYTCNTCGQLHEEWPALTFISPTGFNVLSETERNEIATLNSDFCIIDHPEQTDRFIRCTLKQKVIDHCEDLEYGLWVSLSEESLNDYDDNFDNEDHITQYFGWLSNNIPEYEFNESIPTTVHTRTGNQRPQIIPHSNFKHPFVYDYYNGITKAEAERRIKSMMNSTKK